jgi:hypothetical protein
MIISADEDLLADILDPNTTITKLGIDLRSKVAQIKLNRKLAHNKIDQLETETKSTSQGR